ncbi:hypothetical protein CANTEDRAFT_99846 [Yamadazyma tenuis ATCC 10573]|uniref:Amino acid permease/ SLC12A domain-containing protein n=1 Tax=Candida tenuis (strain ATCC 10573 / BCRC 21748 / CBS 615 / JCM 9827 / NBRC 10315 / NRRL Y-1498 / VKM Y-70) TaxID=590646 RepID=G3BDZ1_CANTC|nr:uncharacterized protein CANTEDRAFT_99846 [Yamadazyma tenuis ATCC 10573]EGV61138.1 hypothetical protein CANTEDRAFT_99846 [Yamadazyma tenuis ATCC 10573]
MGCVPDNSRSSAIKPLFSRIIDSFKPIDLEDDGIDTSEMSDLEKAIYGTSRHPLARRLKNRHIQMIAIGGTIGTGLFVGNGYALSFGPGSLLIGYTLVGIAMLLVMNALGELASQFPVSGAFNAYFTRFIDDSFGFTLGLLYACSWLISFPSELIACAMTIQYWNDTINPAVWIAVFYVIISGINLFGVKGYGEAEFVLSLIKVIAVIGFIILGICIICGVGSQGYIGGKYWHNPGSFNHGFKGLCNTFIVASFSYGGVEMSALLAAESENVRKSIPKAIKQVFWRITIFYFLTSIVIGCLVPYSEPRLLNGQSDEDIRASPFVIAINNGGIKVVPHIMNAVILLAVVSVGSSSVYGCSRTIASLAAQSLIPKIFGYIDREGRPLVAIMVTNVFGLLGFLVASENEGVVFTWLFSICSLSSFFTWFNVCLTHVRFRWALYHQGRYTDELVFESRTGLWGSYIGMVLIGLIIVAEFYVAIFPVGGDPNAEQFFQYCLSVPLMLVLWASHKTVRKSWGRLYVKLEDIDLDTGRREVDIEYLKQDLANERAELAAQPWYIKVYKFWC